MKLTGNDKFGAELMMLYVEASMIFARTHFISDASLSNSLLSVFTDLIHLLQKDETRELIEAYKSRIHAALQSADRIDYWVLHKMHHLYEGLGGIEEQK
ncbi:hypothetical protein [Cohnella algarum]|uniref:hypothetical protein n=1 Tax=Cohnella algarum TaxID=2044859 RepID=UPI001967CC5C|nr:hypothetical protein [Cohnella algarum]MBN2983233.1 hypothetical protein [Cohnella algarum]